MSHPDDSYFNDSNVTDPEIRVRDEYQYIFTTKAIRDVFIRKVYGILMVQLCLTLGIISFFLFYEPVGDWLRSRGGVIVMINLFCFIIIIALTCCGEGLRRHPIGNLFCFLIFTLVLGTSIGVTATNFRANSVLLSMGIAIIVCVAVILFSCQSRVDFMGFVSYLYVTLVVCVLFGLLGVLNCHYFYFHILSIALASFFALLVCLYLVYDTQMIVGGRQEKIISPNEYSYTALSLYLDIITIFLNILCIFGSNGDD